MVWRNTSACAHLDELKEPHEAYHHIDRCDHDVALEAFGAVIQRLHHRQQLDLVLRAAHIEFVRNLDANCHNEQIPSSAAQM